MDKFAVLTPSLPGRELMLSECSRSVSLQTVTPRHVVAVDSQGLGNMTMINQMARSAGGADWLIPLPDDCYIDPDHVEIIGKSISGDDIVYSWCKVEGSDVSPNRLFNGKALARYNYIPVTAAISRKLFVKLHGFQYGKQDPVWNFWLRAMRAGAKFRCVPEETWTVSTGDDVTQAARKAVKYGAVQKPGELEGLLRLVDKSKPRVIVEIGTAGGQTLWGLSQFAADDALIVSIDIPAGAVHDRDQHGRDVYSARGVRNQIKQIAIKDQKVVLINQNSQSEFAIHELEKALSGRKVDLLMIDGDHTYDGVKHDFETYSGYVADKGMIVFHDVVDHHREDVGVHQFWSEVKEDCETIEFVYPSDPPWGGIGVVLGRGRRSLR